MTSSQERNTLAGIAGAQERAREIGASGAHAEFVEMLRRRYPWRFQLRPEVLDRDYLRVVDHHLKNLIPRIEPYIGAGVRRVLDFGCGSGGSAIALAMVFPGVHCTGTDISPEEIYVAERRSALYGVPERCEFRHVAPGERLPFPDGSFDFCQCSSVLEYCVEPGVRQFCVREMLRLLRPGGLLFVSVPNRLYPFEIHTGKWGWNYFPGKFNAPIVDSTYWEIRKLARPFRVRLYRTPLARLFRPWSNFCVEKAE
jgi:SAM-dependent methyltransferase